MTHFKKKVIYFLFLTSLCCSMQSAIAQPNSNTRFISLLDKQKLQSGEHLIDIKSQSYIIATAPELFRTYLVTLEGTLIPVLLNKATFGSKAKGQTRYYTGKIIGQPSSFVTLKVNNKQIAGVISNRSGNQRFGSIDGIIHFEEDHLINKQWDCSSDQLYNQVFENRRKNLKSTQGDTISIYVECDFDMYQSFGSSTAAVTSYVDDLFHQVSAIYQQEDITLLLGDLYIWQSPDPYDKTSVTAALSSFRNQVGPFDATFAHLLSTYTQLSGGIALTNGLCYSGNAYGYSNIDGTLGQQGVYSWDVHVVAHEIGHNLGSPHTHDCAWGINGDEAIDACGGPAPTCDNASIPQEGGTIMSYCHQTNVGVNFSLGFGQEPGDLIRNTIGLCLPEQGESCNYSEQILLPGTMTINEIASGSGATNNDATHARWYVFSPEENGVITVRSCEQGIDTRLFLYTGSCNDLIIVGNSDDDCHSGSGYFYASQLSEIPVVLGESYFLEWDDKWASDGFEFIIDFIPDSYTCNNGAQDGDETGIDCGGSCTPCMLPCNSNLLPQVIDSVIAYRTMDTLSYQGLIMNQGKLEITSSNGIEIDKGFEIALNGTFEIIIGDCEEY